MTIDDLIKKYRYVSTAAKVLGVSRQTVYSWRKHGIPRNWQLEIRRLAKKNLTQRKA